MTAQPYSGADNLAAMTAASHYNEFLVQEVLRHAGKAGVAVDFGAGSGTFACKLRERGLDVVCIESDRQQRLALQSRGFVCHEGIDQLSENSVDYIFSLNVLEHIEDDDAMLHELYRRLRPGGRLYLYVPAFPMLYTSMDHKVGHHRRYRARPLCRQLEKAGLSVLDARYADSLGFLVTLLYGLIGSRKGDLNLKTLRFYDRWLFPLSRLLDTYLCRVLGKNLAIAAVRPAEVVRINPPFFLQQKRSPAAR